MVEYTSSLFIVSTRPCLYTNCLNERTHNYPFEKVAVVCKHHRLKGMVCLNGYEKQSKRCTHSKCQNTPLFNYPEEETAIVCEKHFKKGMMMIYPYAIHQ